MPSVDRPGIARVESTPLRRKTPLGRPLVQLNMSPLTPASVARRESLRCMLLTVSRPVTVPFERTGARP